MIGAIIGDIVGSRFEFNNHRSTDFQLFHPDCTFTDDTICTVAVAEWLLSDTKYLTGEHLTKIMRDKNILTQRVDMVEAFSVGFGIKVWEHIIASGTVLQCVFRPLDGLLKM